MAIRYDSQLKSEIRKTVKSFNAKIRRLDAKGVSAALLPKKVSSKELRQGFDNRRDLRKRINQLNEFTSAGIVEETETGLLGTNELFMYRQGEANRAIQALQQEYNTIDNLETRYPMMKGEYASNLRAKMNYLARDIRTLDVKQVNIFNKNLLSPEERRIKDEQFYNNFQRMLFFNAYKGDIPPSLLRQISAYVERLSPQELLELHNTEPAFKAITEGYQRNKAETGEIDEQENKEAYNALLEKLIEKVK